MPKTVFAAAGAPAAVSLYDARQFFEKALHYGLQHGVINTQKLDDIRRDAPKGMVQIARYFGSEYLRPELEKARDRIVNLVSLHLESASGGDLSQAAGLLRDHSFMSRSKCGSDMLKALIAMPQNSHFGMHERRGFADEHIPLLAKWSLRSFTDYQAELAKRRQVAQVVDAAVWLAGRLGLDEADLEEAGKDAEAVIRTALLVAAAGRDEMPDWIAFDKIIGDLRRRYGSSRKGGANSNSAGAKKQAAVAAGPGPEFAAPAGMPAHLAEVVEAVARSVTDDLPKILDAALATRQLFDATPSFMGRYFWTEDALGEVDQHDRMVSDAWNKVTGGNTDDGSLLTLLLCVAAGQTPKTLLSEKSAAALLRKIRKSGFQPRLAQQYIADHAPAQYQHDYEALWDAFVEEGEGTLLSDSTLGFNDALALLRRECHIV
jgi:hypothetical protein